MATFNADHTAKYQTTTDADIEEKNFQSGDEVSLVQKWDNGFVLIKDDDGIYYNVPQDIIAD